MEFSRQEYRSEFLFPSPGDLPDPGIQPRSPALQLDSLPFELPGKSKHHNCFLILLTLSYFHKNSSQNWICKTLVQRVASGNLVREILPQHPVLPGPWKGPPHTTTSTCGTRTNASHTYWTPSPGTFIHITCWCGVLPVSTHPLQLPSHTYWTPSPGMFIHITCQWGVLPVSTHPLQLPGSMAGM